MKMLRMTPRHFFLTNPDDFATIYELVLEPSEAHWALRKVYVDLNASQGQDIYVTIR